MQQEIKTSPPNTHFIDCEKKQKERHKTLARNQRRNDMMRTNLLYCEQLINSYNSYTMKDLIQSIQPWELIPESAVFLVAATLKTMNHRNTLDITITDDLAARQFIRGWFRSKIITLFMNELHIWFNAKSIKMLRECLVEAAIYFDVNEFTVIMHAILIKYDTHWETRRECLDKERLKSHELYEIVIEFFEEHCVAKIVPCIPRRTISVLDDMWTGFVDTLDESDLNEIFC